ncbi:MAG: lysostaphin resistance A-like protein, partial [Candidatus Omnitrophota bacterium]
AGLASLYEDFIVHYCAITGQDPNSNPQVKAVREGTAETLVKMASQKKEQTQKETPEEQDLSDHQATDIFRSSLEGDASPSQAGLLNSLNNKVARGPVASPSAAPVATNNEAINNISSVKLTLIRVWRLLLTFIIAKIVVLGFMGEGFIGGIGIVLAVVLNWKVFIRWIDADHNTLAPRKVALWQQIAFWSVVALAGLFAVSAAVSILTPLWALVGWNATPLEHPLLSVSLEALLISAVIVGPIMEEFSMRAGYYNAFKAMFGKAKSSPVIAALVSSILFSLLHNTVYGFNPFSFFEIIWLSIVFTAAYELSGSIWAAIGVHAVKNGLAFISVAAKRGAIAPYSLEVTLIVLAMAALSAIVSYVINTRREKAVTPTTLNNSKISKETASLPKNKVSSPAPTLSRLALKDISTVNLPSQQLQLKARAPPHVKESEFGFWRSSWKVILHFGLVIGATKLTLFVGAAYTLFHAFVPSLLVMAGIFFLWMDYKAWQNDSSAKILYLYNSSSLSKAEAIALKRLNAERITADYIKKNGGFSDEGIIGFVSKVFRHPLTALAFTLAGAIIAATGAKFIIANVITGAVIGLLMPYLFNILWNFFWSYMVADAALQETAKQYLEERLSKEDINKLGEIIKQVEQELANTESYFGKLHYYLQEKFARAAIAFPAVTGILKFFLGRLQLVLWGSVIAAALEPFMGTFALRSLLGWGRLAGFANSWGLPFTVGGLFRIAVIVLGLKLVGRGFNIFRNRVQTALKVVKTGTLDAETIFKELLKGNLKAENVAVLFRKGLINFSAKPGLKGLIRKQLEAANVNTSSAWLVNRLFAQTRVYLIADVIAVMLTLMSPFAGLFYALHVATKNLTAGFLKSHPLYTLWLSRGKEFWVSFWHMWIISAEIGAVIGSGKFMANHPIFKYVGGEELGQLAELLEGHYGAISWGGHALGIINNTLGFNVSQILHNALGGKIDVASWEYAHHSGIAFELARNSAYFNETVESLESEIRAKYQSLIKDISADEFSGILRNAAVHVYSKAGNSNKEEFYKATRQEVMQYLFIRFLMKHQESRTSKQPRDPASGSRPMGDDERDNFRKYLADNFSKAKDISTEANVQAALQAAIAYARTHDLPRHAQYLEEIKAKGLIRAMPLNGRDNQPEDLVVYATVYVENGTSYIVEDTNFSNTADANVRVAKYLHEAAAAINNKTDDKESRAVEARFYEDTYKDMFDEKALALIEKTKKAGVSETVKDKKGNDWFFVDGRPMFMRSALVTHTAPGELPHKKGIKQVNPNVYWQFIDRDRNGKPDAMELFIDRDGDGKFTEGVDERTTVFELARKYGFNTLTIFGDIINHELFPKEYFNANSPMRFTVAFDLDEYMEVDYSKRDVRKDLLIRWLEMVERNKDNRYIMAWQLGNEKKFELDGDFDEVIKLFEAKKYKKIPSEWIQAIGYLFTVAQIIKATREKDILSRPFIIGEHEAKEKYLKLMKYVFDKEDISDGVILGLNLYNGNDIDDIFARIKKHLGFPVFLKEFGHPAYILPELLKLYENPTEPTEEETSKATKAYGDALAQLFKAKDDKGIVSAKAKLEKAHQELIAVRVRKAAASRAKADANKGDAALQNEARIAAEEVQALWVENIAVKVFYNSHGLGNGNAIGFSVFRFLDGWYGANWWMDSLGNDPYTQDPVAEKTQDGKLMDVGIPAKYFFEDWFGLFGIVAGAAGTQPRISAERMRILNRLFEQQISTPEAVEYKPVIPEMPDKVFEDILVERSRLAIIKAYKLLNNKDYKSVGKYIRETYFSNEDAEEVKAADKKMREAEDRLLEARQKHAAALRNKTDVDAAALELYNAEKAVKDADREFWKVTLKFSGLTTVLVEAVRENERFSEQGTKPGELRNYWALDDGATVFYLYIQSLLQQGKTDGAFKTATALVDVYKNGRIWILSTQTGEYKFKTMQEVLLEFKKVFSADQYKTIRDVFEGKKIKAEARQKKASIPEVDGLQLTPDTQDDLKTLLEKIKTGQFSSNVNSLKKMNWLAHSYGCSVWNIFARILGDYERYAVRPIDSAYGINSTQFDIPGPGNYYSSAGRMLWFYQNGNLGTGVIQILDKTEDNALMSDAALRGVFSITLRKTGEQQGYQWFCRGFRGRWARPVWVTYSVYEVIFEHDGQLKKLPSIWDLREAIINNDFSKAQPANVQVFKFKMNQNGQERLVVMLIDNETGEGEIEILKIEQHPQHEQLKQDITDLLNEYRKPQDCAARIVNLARLEAAARQLLDYDTKYTNMLTGNKEFVNEHPGLMFRVNGQSQAFFEVIEPGIIRTAAEVDRNNPYGARVVRDVKVNLNDPEQRLAFLRAQITGDFSAFGEDTDTGARVLIDKKHKQILVLRYDKATKKLIEGTILKLGSGLRFDSIFVGDIANRIVFERSDRTADVITGEEDVINFNAQNSYEAKIVRRMTEEQIINWFRSGATPGNASRYGTDTGIRRVYSFDHTPKDKKSEGRYEFEQILVRYELAADGRLGKVIEVLHEFSSTKPRDLEPGSWFFGRRLRLKTVTFQFIDGKFLVAHDNIEYEIKNLADYLNAIRNNDFSGIKKTGRVIEKVGKLPDGHSYVIVGEGNSHQIEIISPTEHDTYYIFKGKVELRGKWRDGDKRFAVALRNPSEVPQEEIVNVIGTKWIEVSNNEQIALDMARLLKSINDKTAMPDADAPYLYVRAREGKFIWFDVLDGNDIATAKRLSSEIHVQDSLEIYY